MSGKKSGETTSSKVASQASKILRNPKSSSAAKSVAASALTQAANKGKRGEVEPKRRPVGAADVDAGFLLLRGSVCCACLGLGFFAIARGGRFKARGRIQIHTTE